MTLDQAFIFGILGCAFGLFIWGRWRYDLVALAALFAAVIVGLVPAVDAFAGFGHPATITVAAVLVISRALADTGATDVIAKRIAPFTGSAGAHIGALSVPATAMSGFMNNVGALGLLMPIALQTAAKAQRAAGVVLMPLAFASILGGLVTVIGTPPNIIVAGIRGERLGEPFQMFDFTPVGLAVALVGVLFVALIGWRLIPVRTPPRGSAGDVIDIEGYVTEARVVKGGKAVGKTASEVEALMESESAQLIGLIRGRKRYATIPHQETLRSRDILIIEAGPEEIDKIVSALNLEIVGTKKPDKGLLTTNDTGLVEAVVTRESRLEGRTVESMRFARRYDVNLLGVARQGRPYRGRLKAFRFRVGDVMLLHGESDELADAVSRLGCLPLAQRGLAYGRRGRKTILAVAFFAAAIVATSFGFLSMAVALGLAVLAMVIADVINPRELYDGVDWPVIVLLGGLIPVGQALEATGGTELIAEAILAASAGAPAIVLMALILIVTMTLSDILNNAATAVVMAPISLRIAENLGSNPDAFLMAVAVGASCAFLTPIGHQNNALIMGPGGYHFGDYWRMGLPLEILIVAVAVPMISIVWPL